MNNSITEILPLGACKIIFTPKDDVQNPIVINETLKDEDTTFSSTTETFKVFIDQLEGPFIAQHIAGDDPATFTCSVILKPTMLPKLSSAYQLNQTGDAVGYSPTAKQVKWGTLKIHQLAMGNSSVVDFNGFKVSCTVAIDAAFKSEGLIKAQLTFNFSADEDPNSKTYGLTYSIGDYVTGAAPAGGTAAPAPRPAVKR